jgi:hypothetical protein
LRFVLTKEKWIEHFTLFALLTFEIDKESCRIVAKVDFSMVDSFQLKFFCCNVTFAFRSFNYRHCVLDHGYGFRHCPRPKRNESWTNGLQKSEKMGSINLIKIRHLVNWISSFWIGFRHLHPTSSKPIINHCKRTRVFHLNEEKQC